MEELEDHVHSSLAAALERLQNGELRDSSRLYGYVWAIIKRQGFVAIRKKIEQRQQVEIDVAAHSLPMDVPDPEVVTLELQRRKIVHKMLQTLRPIEREVLHRFYVDGQDGNRICKDLDISSDQFKNIKHRAKERLAEKCGDAQTRSKRPAARAQPIIHPKVCSRIA